MPDPLSVFVDTYGTGSIPDEEILTKVKAAIDSAPARPARDLDLKRSSSKTSGQNNRYQQTAAYGHFGRTDYDVFTWEKLIAPKRPSRERWVRRATAQARRRNFLLSTSGWARSFLRLFY